MEKERSDRTTDYICWLGWQIKRKQNNRFDETFFVLKTKKEIKKREIYQSIQSKN